MKKLRDLASIRRSSCYQALACVMLRLLLLRHAEAVAHAASGDIERRLTAAGRAGAARIGAYFRKSGLAPDFVLVSPSRRTRETLEIVERELARELSTVIEPSLYSASLSALLDALARAPAIVKTLLIVGHNPSLAEVANALAKDGEGAVLTRMRSQFPAPCLAVIDFHEDNWSEARVGRGALDRFVTLATLSG